MKSRTVAAVERAGKLDRAQREAEEGKGSAARAHAAVEGVDPEVAAIFARIMMDYDRALEVLARS